MKRVPSVNTKNIESLINETHSVYEKHLNFLMKRLLIFG